VGPAEVEADEFHFTVERPADRFRPIGRFHGGLPDVAPTTVVDHPRPVEPSLCPVGYGRSDD
jgi:hypothetical protein